VQPATRVLLVDDHRMFTELLSCVLGVHDDLTVAGVAHTGADAVALADTCAPDVVVLDYRLPGDDGLAVATQLRRASPELRLVMLSGYDDPRLVRAATSVGCEAFLSKDRAPGDLVAALRRVPDGHTEPAAPADTAVGESPDRTGELTVREREVLRLLTEGASTREIASALFISVNTARNHVQRVIGKLGTHSRLGAVAAARRAGMLEPAAGTLGPNGPRRGSTPGT
jgi:DNA-binding NarL/FixJ family response regulator